MEEAKGDELINLPPGFRFHPTDEEIITHYLNHKVIDHKFSACAIGEVDLNKSEPWDLPKKAKMGEKEWYFFCQRDRKYPTGMRTNRATEAGYWKATGKDKEIYKGKSCLVGMKKTLVFYKGRAPKGEKTNWVMHEYRLEGKFSYYKSSKEEWVVCRVFHKNTGLKKIPIVGMNSFGDDFFDYSSPLPPLMDPSSSSTFITSSQPHHHYHDHDNDFKPISNTLINNTPIANNNFNLNPQNYQKPPQVPMFYQPGVNNINPSFLHQPNSDQSILQAIINNNESSNNQSMVSRSQDTCLSTDVNTTEISSVGFEAPSSSSIVDLDGFWNDY